MSWHSVVVAIFSLVLNTQANSEIVFDSDDNVSTLYSGTWTQITHSFGFVDNYFALAQGGGSADSARFFSPKPINSTGSWCIQARWTSGATRTPTANYQVYDGSKLRSTFTVNQQINGGAWRRLGCVVLTAGNVGEVRLSDAGVAATQVVVAEGIRWVRDSAYSQPSSELAPGELI